jgi:hypothetical protein
VDPVDQDPDSDPEHWIKTPNKPTPSQKKGKGHWAEIFACYVSYGTM